MSQVKILTVEHQSNGGLGMLGERLQALGAQITVVGPDAGKEVPESLSGYDALIVLGGSMGPTDDHVAPWLPRTRKLLQEAHEKQVPTLGICLGAQLLVTALGGLVKEMPDGPEVGLQSVTFTANNDDPLFGSIVGEVPVIQWHWLESVELPENTTVFASSSACKNQAFRVADSAWAVQFHPEALTKTAEDWAAEDAKSVSDLGLTQEGIV
ncbi:MAG TPA: type 1 glutamine amidotransferase, partial [Microbacteriaceae bacterium]|nr:type 1 glutamine amidotransferase [Microbacteriaceae bacterium]